MVKLETVLVIVLGLGLLLGITFLMVKNNQSLQPDTKQADTQVPLSGDKYKERVSDEKDVVVKVKPLSLKPGSEVKFELSLDTHSVALDYDLLKVASLTDDQGRTLKPTSWTGGSGGHHLSGELVFPDAGNIKSLELVILGIDSIDRKFKWEIK